jgi:hypothetical protein
MTPINSAIPMNIVRPTAVLAINPSWGSDLAKKIPMITKSIGTE